MSAGTDGTCARTPTPDAATGRATLLVCPGDCSALLSSGAEPGQRCAQQAVEASRRRWFTRQRLERNTHLRFAKAEMAQGGEDFRPQLEPLRMHLAAVLRAVGMAHVDSAAFAALEAELAVVDRAVMRSAHADEIRE